MRLALKESGAARIMPDWTFDHGRRTIGRSRDCDWQVSDDERRVSKLHCIISRDRAGFVLADKSANGTLLDGRLLQEGDSARLVHGSRIDIGGQSFEVVITGEADADLGEPDPSLRMSDDVLTISSILSDVAPGGRSSRSIMGRGGFIDDLPMAQSSDTTKPQKTISRNVDIGWSEPPAAKSFSAVLPDDWNSEPTTSSQHEHTDARRTAIHLPRSSKAMPKADFEEVFPTEPQPERASSEEPVSEPAITDHRPTTLERLAEALTRLESETVECFAILDIDYPSTIIGREFHDEDAAIARVDELAGRQRALTAALERMIAQSTQAFEPRLIEARADRDPQSWQVWLKKPDHWLNYKKQFEQNGRQISVRQFLQKAARGEHKTGAQPGTRDGVDKGEDQQDEA